MANANIGDLRNVSFAPTISGVPFTPLSLDLTVSDPSVYDVRKSGDLSFTLVAKAAGTGVTATVKCKLPSGVMVTASQALPDVNATSTPASQSVALNPTVT